MLKSALDVRVLGRCVARPFAARRRLVGRLCSRREVTEDDLVKLLGSREEVQELMKDEPDDGEIEFPTDMPYQPRILRPLPKKGTRNSRLHRETDVWSREPVQLRTPPEERPIDLDPQPMEPVPWGYVPDLAPKEPLVQFPPNPPAHSETRTYHWKRREYTQFSSIAASDWLFSYIPGIGDIYPDDNVHVCVTLTNDVDVSEQWAQERLDDGHQIYGLETKWWTWVDVGMYYSDSYPGTGYDLALLQLATEEEVLLLQPLDMPVECMGPQLRQILKHKFIKKASFNMAPKAKALKECEVKVHGCHDFGHLLTRQTGVARLDELSVDFSCQNLASMAKMLLGLDLAPRDVCSAHWEQPQLQDHWVELAAKEAWACWALYGVVTRMESAHVELWNASLPDAFLPEHFSQESAYRAELLRQHGITLPTVTAAERKRTKAQTTPNWKVAKQSAVELAYDLGLDLDPS